MLFYTIFRLLIGFISTLIFVGMVSRGSGNGAMMAVTEIAMFISVSFIIFSFSFGAIFGLMAIGEIGIGVIVGFKITSKDNKVESEIKPSMNTHKMTKNIEENKKTSKICDNCETENVNEAKFCMNCGKQNFNENYNQDKFKKEEVNSYKVKTLKEEDELEKIRNKYVENFNKKKLKNL